jgi:YfiH family protein
MEISCYESALLREAGCPRHGFTKTQGGVSVGPYAALNLSYAVGDEKAYVDENRRRFKAYVGVDTPLATVRQVHGAEVAQASVVARDDWLAPPEEEADAMVTDRDAVLAVQTADCAAVLLFDPESRIVAAAHAGWRGTARGVIRKTLKAMGESGASPARIVAAIGPCIGPACYEVGEEVARRLPESAEPIRRARGKYLMDLANAVEVSLIVAGVRSDNIDKIEACTHCKEGELFSYRRSGGVCGRMFGFISGA